MALILSIYDKLVLDLKYCQDFPLLPSTSAEFRDNHMYAPKTRQPGKDRLAESAILMA